MSKHIFSLTEFFSNSLDIIFTIFFELYILISLILSGNSFSFNDNIFLKTRLFPTITELTKFCFLLLFDFRPLVKNEKSFLDKFKNISLQLKFII